MAIELEKIKAWDGQSGTGADARGVIDRNFEKVKDELESIDTKFSDVEDEIVQLAGDVKYISIAKEVLVGKAVSSLNGSLFTPSVGAENTTYTEVPVSGLKKIYYTGMASSDSGAVFLNKDKTFHSTIISGQSSPIYNFETVVPEGVFYARASSRNSNTVVDISISTKNLIEETFEKVKDNEQEVARLEADKLDRTASIDLFKENNEYLFPDANLVVRRYQADETFNDYAAGYSQTALADGLRVAIPASGSTGIKHYLRTGLFKIGTLKAHFMFNGSTTVGGSGAGIGYIDVFGNFIFYYLSGSGQFRKAVNYSLTVNLTAGITYDNGDTISYSIEGNRIVVTKNGVQSYSHTLDVGEFETEILIGQAGFPQYTVYLQDLSDPIRQYVSSELANFENLPECFYSYDPLAIPSVTAPTNTGMFTIFVKIKGNKYSGFHLGHEIDMRELQWQDYWRIRNASIYEYDGSQMLDTGLRTVSGGESECVWKRNASKDDFTGGTHGDEIVSEVLFFANGVQINESLLTGTIPLTPCDNFYYLQKSTMHATAEGGVHIEGHPIECYHVKKTDFKDKGYTTFNQLEWVNPGLVTLWYHGICCLSKDVGYTFYSEDFNEHTEEGLEDVEKYRNVWYRNDDNNFSAHITSELIYCTSDGVDVSQEKDNKSVLFVSNRTTDNKYYRRVPATTVGVGDVWKSVMRVEFN